MKKLISLLISLLLIISSISSMSVGINKFKAGHETVVVIQNGVIMEYDFNNFELPVVSTYVTPENWVKIYEANKEIIPNQVSISNNIFNFDNGNSINMYLVGDFLNYSYFYYNFNISTLFLNNYLTQYVPVTNKRVSLSNDRVFSEFVNDT